METSHLSIINRKFTAFQYVCCYICILYLKNYAMSHSPKLKLYSSIQKLSKRNLLVLQQIPWPVVRKRTIPTERSPLVGEASANFSGFLDRTISTILSVIVSARLFTFFCAIYPATLWLGTYIVNTN
jgi:hypothetical protein